MIDIMTQPALSSAKFLFQKCISESSSEGNAIEVIRNCISGKFLEDIKPTDLNKHVWNDTLGIISINKKTKQSKNLDQLYEQLPQTLQNYLINTKIKWKNYGNIKVSRINSKSEKDKLELIYVNPNASIPQHTHEGNEAFLVLHGSYKDQYGTYNKGSVQIRNEDHDHMPIGHPTSGCIGLAYTEGKIKFSGKFYKILNFFN